jgi:hypothetical protein
LARGAPFTNFGHCIPKPSVDTDDLDPESTDRT